MPHTIINPGGLHDPTRFGYSHVACASGDLVFIAGQYASDGDGHVTSPDFAEQVDRSLANLRTALTAAGLDYEDVVQLRTHIVGHDAAKLEILADRIARIWGSRPPTQTLTGVAALACPPCSSRSTPSPSAASDEHVMQAPGITPGMITR